MPSPHPFPLLCRPQLGTGTEIYLLNSKALRDNWNFPRVPRRLDKKPPTEAEWEKVDYSGGEGVRPGTPDSTMQQSDPELYSSDSDYAGSIIATFGTPPSRGDVFGPARGDNRSPIPSGNNPGSSRGRGSNSGTPTRGNAGPSGGRESVYRPSGGRSSNFRPSDGRGSNPRARGSRGSNPGPTRGGN